MGAKRNASRGALKNPATRSSSGAHAATRAAARASAGARSRRRSKQRQPASGLTLFSLYLSVLAVAAAFFAAQGTWAQVEIARVQAAISQQAITGTLDAKVLGVRTYDSNKSRWGEPTERGDEAPSAVEKVTPYIILQVSNIGLGNATITAAQVQNPRERGFTVDGMLCLDPDSDPQEIEDCTLPVTIAAGSRLKLYIALTSRTASLVGCGDTSENLEVALTTTNGAVDIVNTDVRAYATGKPCDAPVPVLDPGT
jgi:hypothetical protein